MKTTNFAHQNTLAWLPVLYSLAFSFALAGCGPLHTFSRLEREASKYGTVSVGAVRVIPYNDLEESRKVLREALCSKRRKLLEDPNMVPQGYWADYAVKKLGMIINVIGPKVESKTPDGSNPPSPPTGQDTSAHFGALAQVFYDMMKDQRPRASEIELIGLRMAALKFIESELEDLMLNEVLPERKGYSRKVISLDCSAWVRGKAKAALVYIDLYPYGADRWCHEANDILKCWDANEDYAKCMNGKGKNYEHDWRRTIEQSLGRGFEPFDPCVLESPKESQITQADRADWTGFCHKWLRKKKLCPRIVHVERMGEAEYLILGQGDYSGLEFQIGGSHPAGVSGALKGAAAKKAEGVTAKVRPLSLAFVAGKRRAGWLFMPSKTEAGRMPPTERRLRMVVDVPEKMTKLVIHIHKSFLDADLGILHDASFKKQMLDMDKARRILTKADTWYEPSQEREPSCPSPRHYRLRKSRMRNLLYQAWSEEIVVDIPRIRTNREAK
jgi:hypothetical protein